MSIEDNVLTIKGQTAVTPGGRRVLPIAGAKDGIVPPGAAAADSVEPDKVEPRYEHGVLTITVPKAEAKRARKLPVQVGDAPTLEGGS